MQRTAVIRADEMVYKFCEVMSEMELSFQQHNRKFSTDGLVPGTRMTFSEKPAPAQSSELPDHSIFRRRAVIRIKQ